MRGELRAMSNTNNILIFDLTIGASAIVLIGDATWLVHDIIKNGMQPSYIFIASMFVLGLIATLYGMWMYHKEDRGLLRKAMRPEDVLISHTPTHCDVKPNKNIKQAYKYIETED
jgi:hypothetical protein